MRDTTHLAWRAALAIALMVSFYGLALVVVALLIAIPLVLARLNIGLFIKVGLFCVVGAYVILKSILPRRDHFVPPGPRLAPEDQPRLFAEIRHVAAAVRQAEPSEVYLVPDVNAWVSHRGGFMGFGSRRVMGLGLSLMQILTVSELRAVVAHEFGHFHGGDVAIGPWVHKTSAALMRTLVELQQHSEALMAPFVWYGNLFFRVTHAVSRHQEVLADRVAAGVAGAQALASGLRLTHGAALAFPHYWRGAVEPVLDAGFVPPLAAGFDVFLKTPLVAGKVAEGMNEQALRDQQTPYDTHPALPDRLSALGVEPSSTLREAGPPSASLLEDLPALETRLVEMWGRRAKGMASENTISLNLEPDARVPTPVLWADVGAKVWVPQWQQAAREFGKNLAGVKVASLPELDWGQIGRKFFVGYSHMKYLDVADSVVGIALALVLLRAGFTVESQPGSEPALVGHGDRVQVFSLRERLKEPGAAQAWRDLCTRTGISDVDLGEGHG